jgi:hypothetical protein
MRITCVRLIGSVSRRYESIPSFIVSWFYMTRTPWDRAPDSTFVWTEEVGEQFALPQLHRVLTNNSMVS